MSRLLELYSGYLAPASDTLLDNGSATVRWNNGYYSGTVSTNILRTGTMLCLSGSATINTLITTNDSRATLNTVVLQQTALTVQAGDVWFMASSNQLFLFCRSNNINFYVAMGTTNAYPAL